MHVEVVSCGGVSDVSGGVAGVFIAVDTTTSCVVVTVESFV